jgi:hypothetical protein
VPGGCELGRNLRYGCTSKTEVLNEQRERLLHEAEGVQRPASPVGQGHMLARQFQRQAGPAPKDDEYVASLLKLAILDWLVPDFSAASRRQKHLSVTIPIGAQPIPAGLPL